MRITCTLVLLLLPVVVVAENWIEVDEDEDGRAVSVDVDSMRKANAYVYAWSLHELPKANSDGERSFKMQHQIACESQQYGLTSSHSYSGAAGSGRVVNSHNSSYPSMNPVVPGTVGEVIVNFACAYSLREPWAIAMADGLQDERDAQAAADAAEAAADVIKSETVAGVDAAEAMRVTLAGDHGSETAESVLVRSVQLGTGVGTDSQVLSPKTVFNPSDTIIASVETFARTTKTPGVLGVYWSYDFQGERMTVHEESQDVLFTGRGVVAFQISKPDDWPLGRYRVDIKLNGRVAKSVSFEVRR